MLAVDDDDVIRALLERYLALQGYTVTSVGTSAAALAAVNSSHPDIVLLDVVLGAENGFDVLSELRKVTDVPVIMLTSRSEEASRVLGLRLGADDYIGKPFSGDELEARIAAVLRRSRKAAPASTLQFGDLTIDLARREVTDGGSVVDLTTKEFDVLVFLASSPGQVFSREQFLHHVWGSSSEWQDTATVTEHVGRIRRKLATQPSGPRVRTVRGVGYSFEP